MSGTFATDNIDALQAFPSADGNAWQITFRSTNEERFHQLYVNGRLADFSDTTAQRSFLVDAAPHPQDVLVVAVDGDLRHVDLSDRLDTFAGRSSWTYRAEVVRSASDRPGARLVLLGDHATGVLDPVPLATRELHPEWSARWGFGDDAFGEGGFGYDAAPAPGLGRGTFGAGPFGHGAETFLMEVPLPEEGQHQLQLRVVNPDGLYADGPLQTLTSCPPPACAGALVPVSYDPQTQTLTLQIQ